MPQIVFQEELRLNVDYFCPADLKAGKSRHSCRQKNRRDLIGIEKHFA